MPFAKPYYSELAGLDPQLIVSIEGQMIHEIFDLKELLLGFSYRESEDERDVMELALWDKDMYVSGHPLMESGNIMTAQWGYRGNLSSVFRCRIMDIDCDYPPRGKPVVTLRALDESVDMAGIKKNRIWRNPDPNPDIPLPGIAVSEIAEAIANEYGMGKNIHPSFDMGWKGNKGRHKMIIQAQESDEVFLQRLARTAQYGPERGQTGFIFYVEGEGGSPVLHFHPYGQEREQSYELDYYADENEGSLLSFRVRLRAASGRGASLQTMARVWDPRKAPFIAEEELREESEALITYRANNDTTESKFIHAPLTTIHKNMPRGASWNEQQDIAEGFLPTAYLSQILREEDELEEAIRLQAEAQFLRGLDKECEADASCIGIPDLRAKRLVKIVGVPYKYAGIYNIKECTHLVIPGYKCEMKLSRRGHREYPGAQNAQPLIGELQE